MTVYLTDEVLQCEVWPGMVDTHCHLDLEPLASCHAEVVSEALRNGVSEIIVPGVHPDGWETMAALADRYSGVHAAFGVHPMHADLVDDDCLARLETMARNAVAVGEVGLDPVYQVSLATQEYAFRRQIGLALKLKLPLLVHCRRAFQRTLNVLRDERAHLVGGVMHAYSGSPEMAREFIRQGFAISVSGMATRQTAHRLRRIVQAIPLEHLVVETDAPDLAPERFLGMPNRPGYLGEVLQVVASVKGISLLEAAMGIRFTTGAIIPALSQS